MDGGVSTAVTAASSGTTRQEQYVGANECAVIQLARFFFSFFSPPINNPSAWTVRNYHVGLLNGSGTFVWHANVHHCIFLVAVFQSHGQGQTLLLV